MPQYVEAEDLEKIVRGLNARIRTLEVGEHVHRLTWTNLTLLGTWTPWDPGGGTWDLGSYAKDVFGVVHLRGLLNCGSPAPGSGVVVANLPTGFWPLRYHYFATPSGNTQVGLWYVTPTGAIMFINVVPGAAVANNYFSWHGITFPTN